MARGLVERVRSFWRICIGARDGSRDKKTKRVPTTPRPHYPVCKALRSRRWYVSYHEKHPVSVLSLSLFTNDYAMIFVVLHALQLA